MLPLSLDTHFQQCTYTCRRQAAVLRLLPRLLSPRVSGGGDARGGVVLQRLSSGEEAALQTDRLGQAGELQVSYK